MTDLATGTVTSLFTDIEGGTRQARQNASDWKAARARHHDRLQTAIDARGGTVFQMIGDALCAEFTIAPDALAAELSLRVRMGLPTGITAARKGQFHGSLTLAHLQRFMALAHGG